MTESARNEKLSLLVGNEGIEKLQNATVMILGLGGVGSNCVEALARGGVGHIIIVDMDTVAASNINRQAIAFHSTLGRFKVDVTREMILDINPQCDVDGRNMYVLPENLGELLNTPADYIIDAIDTIATKLSLALYAQEHGLKLVSAMGAANKLDPQSLEFADLYDTQVCPLCRIMRHEGRAKGIEHLDVLYSKELPIVVSAVPGATRKDRSNLGTMSYMPSIMGQMIAGRIIREIVGM